MAFGGAETSPSRALKSKKKEKKKKTGPDTAHREEGCKSHSILAKTKPKTGGSQSLTCHCW